MTDCRLILDNLNDYVSLAGPLVTGSDVIDISGAQMAAAASGWQVTVSTVAPAQQNPRLPTTIIAYLDVDGRADNNATSGLTAGADTAFEIVYAGGGWHVFRGQIDHATGTITTVPTNATYSISAKDYTLNIPYAEVPKTAPAYWRVAATEADSSRRTIDYAPDAGMACTPSLAPKNSWTALALRVKTLWNSGLSDQVLVGVVVLAALLVVLWRWIKSKKEKPS